MFLLGDKRSRTSLDVSQAEPDVEADRGPSLVVISCRTKIEIQRCDPLSLALGKAGLEEGRRLILSLCGEV